MHTRDGAHSVINIKQSCQDNKDQAKVTEAMDAPKPDRLAMCNGFKKDGIRKANKEAA